MSQCFEESIWEGISLLTQHIIILNFKYRNKTIIELVFHVLEKNTNVYADLGGCFPASESRQSAWFITSYTASLKKRIIIILL